MKKWTGFGGVVMGVVLCATAAAAPADKILLDADSTGSSAVVTKLIADYYDAWLRVHPLDATELGFHQYDHDLPDVGVAAMKNWGALAITFRARLRAAHALASCDARCQIDLAAVEDYVDRETFDRNEIVTLERYPSTYIDLCSRAVFTLIKRSFAPLPVRAESVIARLDKLGGVLSVARRRLLRTESVGAGKPPPLLVSPIAVDIALEELDGAIDFIGKDVPSAFASLPAADQARVRKSADGAVQALRDFGGFLRTELKPKAKGGIALGDKLFRGKLHADEQIDEPLDALLARGETELARLQRSFTETARAIDPKKDPRVLKVELGRDHPAPNEVIAAVRDRLLGLRTYIRDKKIVSIPSDVMPIVDETPPFMRATTQASMDTAGAYETVAKESYYHITLPDPSWAPARVEDYLGGAFNRTLIDVVSIHEAFPGHFVQFLWIPHLSGRARRMQGVSSNIEGWAHYCEQMMIDSGWGDGSPKVRLAQLSDALLRAARYVVAIRMHTRGMTVAEARKLFVEQGYQSDEVANIESKRGTEDPTYLYYTWGKLEILKLREELQRRWGKDFALQRFHDALLAEGPIPLPLLRKAMLGDKP